NQFKSGKTKAILPVPQNPRYQQLPGGARLAAPAQGRQSALSEFSQSVRLAWHRAFSSSNMAACSAPSFVLDNWRESASYPNCHSPEGDRKHNAIARGGILEAIGITDKINGRQGDSGTLKPLAAASAATAALSCARRRDNLCSRAAACSGCSWYSLTSLHEFVETVSKLAVRGAELAARVRELSCVRLARRRQLVRADTQLLRR
ncbi:hypothetical protein HW555_006833, partial [Spodoptera exigua]